MDGYMTTKEASAKWDVSVRQVQNYCKRQLVPNVIKVGTNYLIPKDTSKPMYGYYTDDRTRKKGSE